MSTILFAQLEVNSWCKDMKMKFLLITFCFLFYGRIRAFEKFDETFHVKNLILFLNLEVFLSHLMFVGRACFQKDL